MKSRETESELMDQPGLDARLHHQALGALGRINRISGSARIVWTPIRTLAATDRTRTWRVLDIASGGGDIPLYLDRCARRSGFKLAIDGCDISNVAVRHAQERADREQASNLRFFQRDAFEGSFRREYDVVMCSLFLHHQSNDRAAILLSKMAAAARRLVLVNDLCRTFSGWALAWAGCHLLTRSPIVHFDGPLSVRSAFTLDEVRRIAIAVGLRDAVIQRQWPCRFLLRWSPT